METVLQYEIAPEIFERFPGYVRGVVVDRGVKDGPAPNADYSRMCVDPRRHPLTLPLSRQGRGDPSCSLSLDGRGRG